MANLHSHNVPFSRVTLHSKNHRKDSLAIDITIVLIIKLAIIYGLWYAFFSQPIDDQLTDQSVSVVLIGNSNEFSKADLPGAP